MATWSQILGSCLGIELQGFPNAYLNRGVESALGCFSTLRHPYVPKGIKLNHRIGALLLWCKLYVQFVDSVENELRRHSWRTPCSLANTVI